MKRCWHGVQIRLWKKTENSFLRDFFANSTEYSDKYADMMYNKDKVWVMPFAVSG